MNTRHILTALATASLIAGGSALAQGRGGGHGNAGHGGRDVGVQTRTDARVNSQGPSHANDRARARANENSVLNTGTRLRAKNERRANSQGPAHANERARARANDNSVLATGRTSADLSLLRPGLTVRNSNGVTLGTIARINRTRDGRIANVLVRDPDGRSRTLPVSPNTLSISGDVVTTTVLGRR